jgi:hypothetical protein
VLLKWIFTILAMLYLYRVLLQLFRPPPPAEPPGAQPIPRREKPPRDDDYIDYEELPP